MSFKFEKLIVWQKALKLSEIVSHVIKSFPQKEVFGLSSQMQRAADSVSLNIAEGRPVSPMRSSGGLSGLLCVLILRWLDAYILHEGGVILTRRILE
jgi:hypothetical protein